MRRIDVWYVQKVHVYDTVQQWPDRFTARPPPTAMQYEVPTSPFRRKLIPSVLPLSNRTFTLSLFLLHCLTAIAPSQPNQQEPS